MVLSGLFRWLEESYFAEHIRQSLWLYPALEIIHITGIAVLVGAAFMFDLWLLGPAKGLTISGLSRYLLSWSRRGLWLVIPSGILLFSTNAESLAVDPTFWSKMALLIVAGVNAFIFQKLIYNRIHQDLSGREYIPPTGKISAIVSIIVWIAVISCGRLLAY
jgi:hypothetical protein